MEEPEETKSRVRLVINLVVWAGLIVYFAYSKGLLDNLSFDREKRVVADVLIKSIDALGRSSSTLRVQVVAGQLYFNTGDYDSAFTVLESALPWIEELDNVEQRHYANVYFVLGEIEEKRTEYKQAEDYLLQGLRLEPQNFHYQLFLGDLYAHAGKRDMAREHYIELLEIPNLDPEQEAIIKINVAKIGGDGLYSAEARKVLTETTYLDYPLITLIPINALPAGVALHDMCLILESEFRMGCFVQAPLKLSAEATSGRDDQIDAVKVIEVLESRYPRSGIAPIVGIVADDMYFGSANYVFSTQVLETGYGVVSTFRFFQPDMNAYNNEQIYARRLAIQLISVVGQLLGFPRPVQPYCPLAYPNSLDEFLLKRASLCSSTRKLLEDLLTDIGTQEGVHFSTFSESKIDDILRVKTMYGIDG